MAVSELHFLLYVCSETHNCKMSQKSAGPHFENFASPLGRIAKLEKCRKRNSKISLDKKTAKAIYHKKIMLPSTNEKHRSVAILQQKLEGTLRVLCGHGSLEE